MCDDRIRHLTDWLVIDREYLGVVGPDRVHMDYRNFQNPGKPENEIRRDILEFKSIVLKVANNPAITGLPCICNIDHKWNLCSNALRQTNTTDCFFLRSLNSWGLRNCINGEWINENQLEDFI